MKKRRMTIIGLLFLVSGIVFLFVTLMNRSRDNRFKSEGINTNGIVIKQYMNKSGKEAGFKFWLNVNYITEDKLIYEMTGEVSKEFYELHPENSAVPVRYLKSEPYTAEIVGAFDYKSNFLLQIILAGVAIVGGILLLMRGRKVEKREK